MMAVGLLSGTSIDGIDAALIQILPREDRYSIDLLAFETYGFDAALADRLREALPPHAATVAETARLHHDLGQAFAAAARAIAGEARVDFCASHGQTIWHDGRASTTLQIGDPFAIREALQATVCFDFRNGDCALGGHGAPLVPYVDYLLFADADEDRVAVNIGGIANLTYLPRNCGADSVRAFDVGPGNMLIDAFIRARSGGAEKCDRGGAHALRGHVNEALLEQMLADEYFAMLPPKSTGRERFGSAFLQQHAAGLERLHTTDGAATLTALTAQSIALALRSVAPPGARLLVSGGGVHNDALMAQLRERCADFVVQTTDAMGIDVDAKEAIAFAILGYETLRGRTANLPAVTGARAHAMLGAIAPFDLAGLLRRVEDECRR